MLAQLWGNPYPSRALVGLDGNAEDLHAAFFDNGVKNGHN